MRVGRERVMFAREIAQGDMPMTPQLRRTAIIAAIVAVALGSAVALGVFR